MPSTYTTNLGIELPADGELDGVWGDVVNENMDILDRAINGSIALSLSGTTSTLTTSDGALSDGQYKLLVLGGSPSGTHTITIAPNDAQKIYFVRNTTAQSVVFTQGSGGNVTIATGDNAIIYSDGAGAGAAVVNITNDFAMSSVKITGGTIDGTTIGGTSAAAGTFTTVTSGLGAVGTPSITFTGDTNTGIWSPAADTIAFSEGGVEVMRINSSGNVGIGTASPAQLLDVRGNAGSNIGAQIKNDGAGRAILEIDSGGTSDAFLAFKNQATLTARIQSGPTNYLLFATGSSATEAMRITSAGNVGIGTASPAQALDVAGSIRGTGNLSLAGQSTADQIITVGGNRTGDGNSYVNLIGDTTYTTFGTRLIRGNTGANASSSLIHRGTGLLSINAQDAGAIQFSTTNTERMRIDSSGNVGIGTTAPTERLQVGTTASNYIAIAKDGVTSSGIKIIRSGTLDGLIEVDDLERLNIGIDQSGTLGTGVIRFLVGSTERVRIDSSGNVGIGNSAPSDYNASADNLVVGTTSGNNGITIAAGTASQGSLYFADGTATAAEEAAGYLLYVHTDDSMRVGTGNTERLRITSAGNVGIGTTSPSAVLDVRGAAYVIGAAGTRTSDAVAGNGFEVIPAATNNILSYNRTSNTYLPIRWRAGVQTWEVDNTERMRIDSAGNVGIGTTAPAAKLEVALGAEGEYMRVGGDNATNGRALRFTSSTTGGSNGALHTINASSATGAIALATNSTERLRVDFSGNVGIGQIPNASQGKLQINQPLGSTIDGALRLTDNATTSFVFNNVSSGLSALWSSGVLAFGTGNATFTERMRIDSSGNVGIGTSSPGQRLQVQGAAFADTVTRISTGSGTVGNFKRLEFTDNAGALVTGSITSFGSAQGSNNDYAMAFVTNAAERMRIDASGNLGLGVTPSAWGNSGYAAINAKGNASFIGLNAGGTNTQTLVGNNWYDAGLGSPTYIASNFATNYTQVGGSHRWSTAPSGTAGNAITFTQAMTLDASGNLLVGTTARRIDEKMVVVFNGGSGSGLNLDDALVSGTATAQRFYRNGAQVGTISTTASATAYNTSSDYRLKENVAPMQNALDTVAQLNPVTYTWKVDGSAGQGFIAHELQAVVPDCVTGEKDAVDAEGNPKYQGVDTSFLVATLVKAIQELKAEVDSLRAQLNP